MTNDLSSASFWTAVLAGLTAVGEVATGSAAPLAFGAAGGVAGNIAASKLQRCMEAWSAAREARLPPGQRPYANHDEAKAIREAQLAAARYVARRVREPTPLFSPERRAAAAFEEWATAAFDDPNPAVEAAVRATHVGVLAQLSGAARPAGAVIGAETLARAAAEAVWAEAVASAPWTAANVEPEIAQWLRAAFDDPETGWFATFKLQWQDALKTNDRLDKIVTHMRRALIEEKLDDIKDDTRATRADASAIRATADLTARGIDDLHAKLDALTASLTADATSKGLSEAAVIALARRAYADVTDIETAKVKIVELIDIAAKVIAKGARPQNVDRFVAEVLARARQLTQAGDLDAAADATTNAYDAWARDEADRANAARQTGLQLLEAGERYDVLAGRYEAAAQKAWDAVALANAGLDAPALWDAVIDKQRRRLEEAQRHPGLADLAANAALCRLAMDRAATPADRARAQGNLGSALLCQGERTGGAAGADLLARAVEAYEAALTVFTREAMPADWATTQMNLGVALFRRGERTGGVDGADLLSRAVKAYEAALTVFTAKANAANWAATQVNLGNALLRQGERRGGVEGLAVVARAVAAYEAALTVYDAKAMPADWATTKNNLGKAFGTQGEWTGGAEGLALLARAVAAYDAALEVRTLDAMPSYWAGTKMNLGGALATQGEWTGGAAGLALLARAVAAYEAALTVFTRNAMPADWAMTQVGLGNALLTQGERTGGAAGARAPGPRRQCL